MKKILFYYSKLNIGGAEKSLIRLMNALTSRGDKVTCLTRYAGGNAEFLLSKSVSKIALSRELVPGKSIKSFAIRISRWIERRLSISSLKQWDSFDIVFVGLQGLSPQFIIDNIKASKKCIFIRNDISVCARKDEVIHNLKKFSDSLDYYICVANSVRESLVREIPEIAPKAVVIYNLLGVDEMGRKISEAPNPFKREVDRVFRIVSVCRISDKSKAIFRLERICKMLVSRGFKFRWYIVGDGEDLATLREKIMADNLQDVIITPGRVDNPFGYYRECDLVAMLSYYEGLCGVVNEAKVAGKPIIATKVSGISEQLTHGENGWIVENSEESIIDGLSYLMSNQETITHLTNKIYPKALIDDNAKIEQIYQLMSASN